MDRLFKTKTFNRWNKGLITDQALLNAVGEMQQGLIDANLGGGVFKKRIALPGKGKRGSARILLATQLKGRWFFIFGFNKNERDNIAPTELKQLHLLAQDLLSLNDSQLTRALALGELMEIKYDTQKQPTD